ncbi:peptide chain release factor N(5)-glutamine methyltransferase [Pedobacter sp. HMF7647]|uniref:Release factor glutamine methyltransferase n=1 Tax=Hufsiella arboris TaxID=2695275 RepID=A0A7K1YCL1_9SPHI|nr:peptide chain release factor N(5)-glutamine methyltransferase [Hufsiella arboris]MXV52170.1 peptide chain release factor N(5)-glutamine methyltransferase [Hufsiella arboris]
MIFRQIETSFIETLQNLYDREEALQIARYAIEHVTGLDKAMMLAKRDDKASEAHSGRLFNVLGQLKTGRPLQYIIGEADFYGLKFKVTEAVLIPRPETEELVAWIADEIQEFPGFAERKIKVLDIGTGSGCIPVSLKSVGPQLEISAIDISEAALEIAKKNADINNVNVDFFESDILNPDSFIAQPYTLIVSNPPYITDSEKSSMHHNVLQFEPSTALFVPDDDPLLFYRAIADFAFINLETNGRLFFEINEHFGKEVSDMLSQKGFKDVVLRKDINGKDRMIKASRL